MSIPSLEPITITNLFANPDMEATDGDVVVWENLIESTSFDQWNAGQGFDVTVEDKVARIEVVGSVGRFFRSPAGNPECEVVTGTFEIWGEGDSVGKTLTMTPGAGNSNFEISIPDSPTVVGATAENVEGLGKTLGILSSGSNVNPLEIGDIFYIRNPMINPSGVRTPFFFDSSFSPDSDLTPQPRPGGGSQLVGTQVAGFYTLSGAVVVQSEQWSKSGEMSARVITTKEMGGSVIPSTRVLLTGAPVGGVIVWRRQNAPVGEYVWPGVQDASNMSVIFSEIGSLPHVSAPAVNAPGEVLMRIKMDEDVTNDSTLILSGGADVGDSVWYDILTIVDDKNYDGPPFSGDSDPFPYQGQTIFPSWAGTPNHTTSSFLYYPALGPWSPSADWDGIGVRYFEAGVDKGMLYLDDRVGVPWSGLVSVDRNIEGAEPTPYYIDGEKFYIDMPPGDYAATVEAYTYPEELERCIGSEPHREISSLTLHHQPPRPFSFAYRTLIGNDVEGTEFGYKIHLVYNAYARPTQSVSNTLTDSPEAELFSWDITTMPERIAGYRPTSYFTIDSRRINPVVLENLEKVLYGSGGAMPKLPPLDRIVSYLQSNS